MVATSYLLSFAPSFGLLFSEGLCSLFAIDNDRFERDSCR